MANLRPFSKKSKGGGGFEKSFPEGGFALGGAVPGCRPAFRPRTRSPCRARTHALRAKTLRCLRPNDHSVPISSPRRLAILFRRCVAASTCAKQALDFVQKCVGSGLSARLGQRSWCLPCRPSLIQWRAGLLACLRTCLLTRSLACSPPLAYLRHCILAYSLTHTLTPHTHTHTDTHTHSLTHTHTPPHGP